MIQTYKVAAPPSANVMYRHVGSKVLKSKAYRDWLADACCEIYAKGYPTPMDGPLRVSITVQPHDRRLRDLDNYAKPCLDLLEAAAVISNDQDVVSLQMFRHHPNKELLHTVTLAVELSGIAPASGKS